MSKTLQAWTPQNPRLGPSVPDILDTSTAVTDSIEKSKGILVPCSERAMPFRLPLETGIKPVFSEATLKGWLCRASSYRQRGDHPVRQSIRPGIHDSQQER